MAASATLALKAGVWFRRGRLFIVSADSLAQRARCQAETPLIVLFRFLRPALIVRSSLTYLLEFRTSVPSSGRGQPQFYAVDVEPAVLLKRMIEIDMNFFAKSVSERFAPKSQHFNALSVWVIAGESEGIAAPTTCTHLGSSTHH